MCVSVNMYIYSTYTYDIVIMINNYSYKAYSKNVNFHHASVARKMLQAISLGCDVTSGI